MSDENNFKPTLEGYKPLRPFNMFMKDNFPFVENTFEALDTYGLICKLIGYLNVAIDNVNTTEENISLLNTAFDELNDYVSHYFDNLDVQEEINNKLDEMAESGLLRNIIGDYISDDVIPLITEYQTQVNGQINRQNQLISGLEDNVNSQVTVINEKINSAVEGSPAGTYATKAALQSADPDHSRIYVVNADGKWYYWSTSDSDWIAGGTYQTSGLGDGYITLPKFNTEVIENNNQRTINMFDIMQDDNSELVIDYSKLNVENKSISSDTGARSSSDYHLSNDYYIFFPKNSNLVLELLDEVTLSSYDFCVAYYDLNFNFLFRSANKQFVYLNTFYSYPTDCYIRFQIHDRTNTGITNTFLSKLKLTIKQETNFGNMKYRKGDNLLNYNIYYDNCYINDTYLNLTTSTSYRTSFPLLLKAGHTYQFKNYRIVAIFEDISNVILVDNLYQTDEYSPENDCFVAISFRKDAIPMVVESETAPTGDIPYVEYLPAAVQASFPKNTVLTGKKYVALGDSFTAGAFSNAPEDDYHIESGLYTGQYKVYPYLIGNRENMQVLNLAVGGMTMANIDGVSDNYLSDTVLANIPADTDYITIKMGINDNPDHHNSPLGTIDSTDTTTFYGNYNHVMTYLINNHKNAKIGIIISNGQTSLDFVNAAINIAKKYGVPYLNETTDEHVPLLIRTLRTDVSSTIKDLRNNEWFVNPDPDHINLHPNAKCHEYESTIVENFLLSL